MKGMLPRDESVRKTHSQKQHQVGNFLKYTTETAWKTAGKSVVLGKEQMALGMHLLGQRSG